MSLKQIAKKIPGVPFLYRSLMSTNNSSKQIESVFTDIYRTNAWGGTDSVSGPGSNIEQTKTLIRDLPALLEDFNIATLLDIPCGDFHWMSTLDLGRVTYTGADIVEELVRTNNARYARPGVHFEKRNLLTDKLPSVDLILCRDCLVHFSFDDCFSALQSIGQSGSRYLLMTTFTARNDNVDIVTGGWRPLNLQSSPFLLPEMLRTINEGCTEDAGVYQDKSLGLWRIEDIRNALPANLR